MKARLFSTVLVLMIGLSTTALAATPEEIAFKKCCKQLNKELKRSLRDINLEHLKLDNSEDLTVKFKVDTNNKLIFHKVTGDDERLMQMVEERLQEIDIYAINSSLQGKMLKFPINFQYLKY
ncbi:hypothetical protein [Carboxylicivirga taeanensis]|uniref:hypothetical protein n=1 Tax=Carboxylicivirga taeanensis TaxID=1416875 RepID=UPI003F6DA762